MRTIEKTVFAFDELSGDAKENARDRYRGGNMGHDWWGFVYYDAKEIGKLMGIKIDEIYFSCFSSQGDGACFVGSYSYEKGAAKAIRDYAPQDVELHRIADQLQAVQRQNFYQLAATCTHSGHYCHSGCMSVDVSDSRDRYRDIGGAEDDITPLMRDFADWIYNQLETEYDYQNSDDTVDENIRANEYEFYENGEIA